MVPTPSDESQPVITESLKEAASSSVHFSAKQTSSVHEIGAEKPPFGSRFLTNEADVWSQNAWDHVPPPDDQEETIARALERQRLAPVPDDDKHKYNEKPARHWDNFYKMNASNFFKNRKWLHVEFPELVAAAQASAGPKTIVEVGCGAGNSAFPLLAENRNPELSMYAYDYSSHAVKLVQNNPLYTSPPTGSIRSAVWDLSSLSLPTGLEPGSADIVVLVFVLSALHPREWNRAVANIHKILKPGGLLLFRDYGRHDLTQLRFKTGRLLEDNLYVRGDKTRVYFFDADELARIFTGSAAPASLVEHHTTTTTEPDASEEPSATPGPSSPIPEAAQLEQNPTDDAPPSALHTPSAPSPAPDTPPSPSPAPPTADDWPELVHPLFGIEQLGVDRRLIVNRKRQLKMYRVWMQGKFRKL
ncbi:hypothetical protein EWM64_g2580 [Hericium alpestre]|uniref:tRNA N(3)-methylcytidine methyltransferase n=1 Tax=Hericium alpestre TaxID=135208 RepID=A0A4Z0A317_9AGAM|nr:hypothetical protein EWM64_g2580 [Hericium alpestre]